MNYLIFRSGAFSSILKLAKLSNRKITEKIEKNIMLIRYISNTLFITMIRIFSPSEKQKFPKDSLLKTVLEKKEIFTIVNETTKRL